MMKSWIILSALVAFVAQSCSSDSVSRRSSAQRAGVDKSEDSQYGDATSNKRRADGSTNLELAKKAAPGSQFRLLTPKGLDRVYSRVFSRQPNGQYLSGCDGYNPQDCTDSLFTTTELRMMDELSITRGVANFRNPTNFTLNYLRYLRTMLYRECNSLVLREWNAVDTDPSANLLVTVKGVPPADNFDSFLRTLLGVDGLDVKIDTAHMKYRRAFEKALGNAPDNQQTSAAVYRGAYTAVCMAIAMDPRVFVY